MKSKKIITLVIALGLVMMNFVGCSSTKSNTSEDTQSAATTTEASTSAKGGVKIGILQKSRSDQYQILLNSAQDAILKELKSSGKVEEYFQVDADTDVQKQLNQADDMIAMKVDVIVMSPVDANGCAAIVEKCKSAGIPLVLVNSKTSNVDQATAFVGSNDVEAGEIMGNYIAKRLGGVGAATGNVLQLEGDLGNSAQIDRDQGLKNTIYKEKNVKVLESLSGKWLREEAMRITEDWLQKYPEISAIATENDNMAMGALNAVINAGRKDKIVIVGVDAIEDALISVKNGELDGTVRQDGQGQGTGSIEVAMKIANGETYDKVTNVPFVLITKDNVDQFLKK